MADLPIACTLSPSALKARQQGLLNALVRSATERSELPDGYRLRFVADDNVLADLARAVDAERRCCRFLRFSVAVEPDEGPITLELTGPPGAREFLTALFEQP
jgi:hypothetical protein